jgi:hypothetical protein
MNRTGVAIAVSLLLQGLPAFVRPVGAWAYQLDGPLHVDDNAQAIALAKTGDVYVGGFLNLNPIQSNPLSWVVVKLSGTRGTQLWQQQFPGAFSSDSVFALAVDDAGDVIAGGSFNGFFALRKLSGLDGSTLWVREIKVTDDRVGAATAVKIDSAGDVFAVGYVAGRNQHDMCAVKVSGMDGSEIWRHVIDGPSSGPDYGYGLAISPLGDIVITGQVAHYTPMLGHHPDGLTVAFSPEDGNELWRHHVEYGGGYSVQADAVGNLFVTGWRGFGGTISTSGTQISGFKLDGSTRAELWHGSIEGDVGGGYGAIDSTGSLVAAGNRLSRRDRTWEFVVGRFLGGSGTLQWVRTPFGASTEFQSAVAICVDGAGNSVAVGTGVAGSNGRDFAVVKYSSSGEERWRRVIAGAGQEEDWALACAIDMSADIIVAGYVTQLAGGQDFIAVKLSGETGEDFEPDAMTLLSLLIEDVDSLELPPGIKDSLLSKLHAAETDGGSVAGLLEAFIHEVEAQRGKKIATTDADGLIESAREILSLLD